jgi:competence protein ComEC
MQDTAESVGSRSGPTALVVPVERRLPTAPPNARKHRVNPVAASLAEALEQRRLFLLLPITMIAGVVAATLAPEDPQPWALGGVAAVLGCAIVAAHRHFALLRCLTLIAGFWVGFSLLSVHGALWGTAMLDHPLYGGFAARVDEVLSSTPDRTTVVVSEIVSADNGAAAPMRRARISVKSAPDLAPGDMVSGRLRFYPVPAPVLPNGFDAQFQGYFDGIGAYGSNIGLLTVTAVARGAGPARTVEAVRRAIADRIDEAMGTPEAPIAKATIIGDQSGIPDEARNAMASAGIAHVLSISGLHLSLVAGGVFTVLRLLLALLPGLPARLAAKKLAALGGMLAGVGYFAISGGSIAALRSTIMILLVFGAVLAGRRALTMRNVALAAVLVILTDPAGIFRASFQLSFAAVVALVGTYELWRRPPPRPGWLGRLSAWVVGAMVTSFVAGAATLLFSVYHFQQAAPLGVLGNLLALPVVAFIIMPAGVFGVLAIPFGLSQPLFAAMATGIDLMLMSARFVAGLSAGFEATPVLTPIVLLVGLGALGWFAFLRDRWRLLGPVLAIPLVLGFGVGRPPDVLISDTTQATAVRGPDGLVLIAGKAGSFAPRVWAETYGQAQLQAAGTLETCDSLACLAESPAGFRISIVKRYDAFAEDCATVDLVVTRLYAPDWCRAEAAVVDAGDLRRLGSQALVWQNGQFARSTAVTDLHRPWRAGQS